MRRVIPAGTIVRGQMTRFLCRTRRAAVTERGVGGWRRLARLSLIALPMGDEDRNRKRVNGLYHARRPGADYVGIVRHCAPHAQTTETSSGRWLAVLPRSAEPSRGLSVVRARQRPIDG